jgi:sugar/nucleoside kinase (ribokinase family)
MAATDQAPASRILCLGEALVDLICERPVRTLAEADSFVPRFGGAVANVAVSASRAGAQVALAGGAGDDPWGHWLRDRLEAECVDHSLFELLHGTATPLAFVTIDERGEPSYDIHGEMIATIVHALRDRLEEAIASSAALFFSSNTLVGADERAVTMRAREIALQLERPVIFDPNLRLRRWSSRADAAASANASVPGALLVRCNLSEAQLMTGEDDPERAAAALLGAGSKLVAITLGPAGAILRGALSADVPGVPVKVRSTVGAGDVLTGTVLARLSQSAFDPRSMTAALHAGVAASAVACERWGALD